MGAFLSQQHQQSEESYLRPPEAAAFLRLSLSTIHKFRCSGVGPAYLQPGGKLVLYKKTDLVSWLESGRRQSTSERPSV